MKNEREKETTNVDDHDDLLAKTAVQTEIERSAVRQSEKERRLKEIREI